MEIKITDRIWNDNSSQHGNKILFKEKDHKYLIYSVWYTVEGGSDFLK